MDWSGKKVLVTGAGGFIGSHLTEALVQRGAEVTALIRYTSRADWGNLELIDPAARKSLRVVAGTVEDPAFMLREVKGKDCVFHLAALIGIPYSYVAPTSYSRTNIEGTVNVMNAALTHGVGRVVHTSTSEVYGTAQYVPIDEKHPLVGQSPYSASKIGADKMAESYYLSFGLPVSTLRPFNTFGPRQSARAIIPSIIAQACAGDVVRVGSLSPERDMTFVKDTVEAFLRIATVEAAIGKTVHIGNGDSVSIGELAKRILALMGSKAKLVEDDSRRRPEKSEVLRLVCDNARAKEILGWSPRHSLTQGLEETISFIRKHLDRFKPETYAT